MSVDPVGTISVAAVEALINAEITALAADAATLRAQVDVGDIVEATVLPSNGLTDLLNVLGNRVAASLPPTLRPGDVIAAQVTGFDGERVLLAIVDANALPADAAGQAAPEPMPPAAPGSLPQAAAASLPPGAAALPTPAGTPAPEPRLAVSLPPGQLAPPAAVFVAASVRSAAGTAIPVVAGDTPAADVLPGITVPPAPAQPALLGPIEARLAAARAAAVDVLVPGAPPGRTPVATPAGSIPARPFSVPPPITTAPGSAAAVAAFVRSAGAGAGADTGTLRIADLARYTDPVALVRALRLPVTPSNVAAARLAIETPQRLPNALATLERALPSIDDPRVATLRTLTAFLGRIDPKSPQLAAQISAYVEHVVDGYEPKLAAQLAAVAEATAPTEEPPAAQTAGSTPAAASGAPGAAPATPALPVVALAQAAERGALLVHDLKAQIFALLASPPRGAGDDLVPAAASALTAVSAVQMAAAQALNAAPGTVAFSLPMWLGSGFAQAHVAVDRDRPEPRGTPLDGDNFHIAFVLDTKHVGTVAIDVKTVGRSVTLAVRTEAQRSAQQFGAAIPRLTDRLEKLHYRIASAEASVAQRGESAAPAAPPEPADEPATPGGVNLRA